MNYNLVDESWIPVLRANGQPEKLGIRRALTEDQLELARAASMAAMEGVILPPTDPGSRRRRRKTRFWIG